MDDLEFATLMIEYEKMYRQMRDMEEKIQQHVLLVKETQKIANVTARYTSGRTVYDYERAVPTAPKELVDKHTKTITRVDWKSVCDEMSKEREIAIPIKKEPEPSVSISVK